MKRLVLVVPIAFMFSLLLPRCAVMVSPTGGPKDTIPPVLVRSIPPKYSTNFRRDKIVLTFDEFFRLDGIAQKLVLSPPQERLPEYIIRGKSLELTFYEPLKDSTTYTLYFSDAIIDNNEGNKLKNFEFAFSTGPEIDSLRLKGKVIDAFTLEPQEGVLVMLYDNFNDSLPLLERPRYVTKTNKEGFFTLSNLMHHNFKLFALQDENSNYIFDQITEAIAFSKDTIDKSMLLMPSEDTIPRLSHDKITLRLFLEENKAVKLSDYSRDQPRRLRFVFSKRPMGKVSIKPVNVSIDTTKVWYMLEPSLRGDSLNFWILDDELSRIDTLVMKATYFKTDSLMNHVETSDTLRMFYMEKPEASSRRGRREEDEDEDKKEAKPTISLKKSFSERASVTPHQDLRLTFGMPLLEKNKSLVELWNMSDTVAIHPVELHPDTLNPRLYRIKHEWKPDVSYRFLALPGAFTDLDGVTNDSLMLNFKGANPENFGIIRLNLSGVEPNIIVQLTTTKGEVVQIKTTNTDGEVRFDYLKPATYKLRFIFDANRNGRWDTGNYLEGIQPERVIIFHENNEPKDIQVRANWEYDINFNLK